MADASDHQRWHNLTIFRSWAKSVIQRIEGLTETRGQLFRLITSHKAGDVKDIYAKAKKAIISQNDENTNRMNKFPSELWMNETTTTIIAFLLERPIHIFDGTNITTYHPRWVDGDGALTHQTLVDYQRTIVDAGSSFGIPDDHIILLYSGIEQHYQPMIVSASTSIGVKRKESSTSNHIDPNIARSSKRVSFLHSHGHIAKHGIMAT